MLSLTLYVFAWLALYSCNILPSGKLVYSLVQASMTVRQGNRLRGGMRAGMFEDGVRQRSMIMRLTATLAGGRVPAGGRRAGALRPVLHQRRAEEGAHHRHWAHRLPGAAGWVRPAHPNAFCMTKKGGWWRWGAKGNAGGWNVIEALLSLTQSWDLAMIVKQGLPGAGPLPVVPVDHVAMQMSGSMAGSSVAGTPTSSMSGKSQWYS